MDIYLKFSIFLIISIAIGNIAYYTYRYFRLNTLSKNQINKLLYGVHSRRDLYNLTPSEFEDWCSFLLRRLGYRNVIVTPSTSDGGKDIVCQKDGEIYYVECKKYLFKELAEHLEKNGHSGELNPQLVGREVLQKFVGAMVGDRVYNGLVITTSDFHDNALEYVSTLPERYKIELIDGKKLCELYEDVIDYEFHVEKTIPNIESF